MSTQPWKRKSCALETAGFLPGDILVVNVNVRPKQGDVACAQLYDYRHSRAQTIFRLWEPPFLVAASFDPALRKAHFVDSENVSLVGVVIASLRMPKRRAA